MPTMGITACCARAASGHAAAAPPSAASNSRRPMVTVIRPSRARCVKATIPRHARAVFTFKEAGCWLLSPLSSASTALLPPPALRERRHRGLARRLVSVRWRAILMIAKGQRPHPRHANWHSGRLHDPANDDAIAEHVEVVLIPLAGRARSRRALEDQIILFHC